MNTPKREKIDMAAELRRSAPPLRAADPRRVHEVCARCANEHPAWPTGRAKASFFRKKLMQAAAGLLLVSSATLLLRPAHRGPTATDLLPDLSPERISAWTSAVVNTPVMETSLSAEADNLAADLTDFSYDVNQRALALLF
jgi:hypothetical protein